MTESDQVLLLLPINNQVPRFSELDIQYMGIRHMKELMNSYAWMSLSKVPKEFRTRYRIKDGLSAEENWQIKRVIAQHSGLPDLPEFVPPMSQEKRIETRSVLGPNSSFNSSGQVFDWLSQTFVFQSKKEEKQIPTPFVPRIEPSSSDDIVGYRVANYGLPIELISGKKIFGKYRKDDPSLLFAPVFRHEASSRRGLVGKATFPDPINTGPFAKVEYLIDDEKVPVIHYLLDLHRSSQDFSTILRLSHVPCLDGISNRDIIRDAMYDQKTVRQGFIVWKVEGTIGQAALIVQRDSGDFVFRCMLFYDMSQMTLKQRLSYDNYVQLRILDRFVYHPHYPMYIGETRKSDFVPLNTLRCFSNVEDYNSALSRSRDFFLEFQFYPDAHNILSRGHSPHKVAIIDVEYSWEQAAGTRLVPSMMAIAVVLDGHLSLYGYVNKISSNGTGTKHTLAKYASSFLYVHNGGVDAFRKQVYFLRDSGYKIYAKGPSTEVQVVGDFGVDTFIQKRSKTTILTYMGLVPISYKMKDEFLGPKAKRLGLSVEIFDLGCASYEILSRVYFDRWTPEILFEAYELTGYDSLDHNPVLEVATFAFHLMTLYSLSRSEWDAPNPVPVLDPSPSDPLRITRRIPIRPRGMGEIVSSALHLMLASCYFYVGDKCEQLPSELLLLKKYDQKWALEKIKGL